MLFVRWFAEQGVWFAPLAGVALFVATPEQRRSAGSTAAVLALGVLFVVNVAGMWPGPARVTCSWDNGFPPACAERRPGTVTLPGSAAESRQQGSARAEVETQPWLDGGSPRTVSAGAGLPQESTPAFAEHQDNR